MSPKIQRYRLAAVFLTIIACLVKADEAAPKSEALLVEVSVFSGRPNPRFLITDAEVIKTMLKYAKEDLPKHPTLKDEDASLGAGLGYTGFLVQNVSSSEADIDSIWVYRDSIMLLRKTNPDPAAKRTKDFRVDSAKKLEIELIKLLEGKKLVRDSVLKHIKG